MVRVAGTAPALTSTSGGQSFLGFACVNCCVRASAKYRLWGLWRSGTLLLSHGSIRRAPLRLFVRGQRSPSIHRRSMPGERAHLGVWGESVGYAFFDLGAISLGRLNRRRRVWTFRRARSGTSGPIFAGPSGGSSVVIALPISPACAEARRPTYRSLRPDAVGYRSRGSRQLAFQRTQTAAFDYTIPMCWGFAGRGPAAVFLSIAYGSHWASV
jgi:hypothetical protein